MDNIIEVKNLVKRYPSFSLNHISFSLPEGCVSGFIGANGAGKTTTIRSILNLARKDAGEVKIFGLHADEHEQEIKDRIGIVMDDGYFYNDLSMKDMKSIIAPAYSKWSDDDYQSYMRKFGLDPKQKNINTFQWYETKICTCPGPLSSSRAAYYGRADKRA